MAKEQKRGNKEARKPKTKKAAVAAAPVGLAQGVPAAFAASKKRK